jgi:hypothetical protein
LRCLCDAEQSIRCRAWLSRLRLVRQHNAPRPQRAARDFELHPESPRSIGRQTVRASRLAREVVECDLFTSFSARLVGLARGVDFHRLIFDWDAARTGRTASRQES